MEEPPFRTFFPVLLMVITLGFFVTDVYTPSLPAIEIEFQTTEALVQLTLSLYLLALAISQLIYGPLSDRFGRRPVMLIAFAASFLGTLLSIGAWNIAVLIVGRVLQGCALGVAPSVGRAIIRDVYSGERLLQVGSYFPIGVPLILGTAPILGGYIQTYLGWRYNFVFIFLYTALLIGLAYRWMPETNKKLNCSAMNSKVFIGTYLHLLKNPMFLGYSFCSSLAFGGLICYFVVSPFLFIINMGLKAEIYGWFALFIAGGVVLGGVVNRLLLSTLGRHRLLVIGVVTLFVGGVAMLIPALFSYISILAVMLPMALFCIGVAMTFSNSFAGAFSPFPQIAGFVGSLFGFIQIGGGGMITSAISLVEVTSQLPLAIFLTVIGVAAYISQCMAFKYFIKQHEHEG